MVNFSSLQCLISCICFHRILPHHFAALRNEKPKTQRRDERIKIDERMRRRKVSGNVQPNGKVVTLAESPKDYDKLPAVRDEDINWGLRVQASNLVFKRRD